MSSIVVFSSHETSKIAKNVVDELIRRNFNADHIDHTNDHTNDFTKKVATYQAAVIIPCPEFEKSTFLRQIVSYCELSCLPIYGFNSNTDTPENYVTKGWLKLLLLGKCCVKVSEKKSISDCVDRLVKYFSEKDLNTSTITLAAQIDEREVFEKNFHGKIFELEWLRNKDGHAILMGYNNVHF